MISAAFLPALHRAARLATLTASLAGGLGMLASTFLGVFLDSYFPSYQPKEYVTEVSDGKIAVLFSCPVEMESGISKAMTALGAEAVKPAEAQQL